MTSANISAKDETYLRGTQITDVDGIVTFQTVFPGWYPGRTPHIHVKAYLDGTSLVTGQIYFPDDISAKIYRDRTPYSLRPVPDTTNARDAIFQGSQREGGGTVLAVSESGDTLNASLLIGIDKSSEAARKGDGSGGFLKKPDRAIAREVIPSSYIKFCEKHPFLGAGISGFPNWLIHIGGELM